MLLHCHSTMLLRCHNSISHYHSTMYIVKTLLLHCHNTTFLCYHSSMLHTTLLT